MTKTDQIAKESFEAGRKLEPREFRAAGGSGGDYCYRAYVRSYNRFARTRDEDKQVAFRNANQQLITLLQKETESLRVQYCEMVRNWATEEFARLEALANSPYPVYREFVKDHNDHKGAKAFHRACDARAAANRTVEKGITEFVLKQVTAANEHYQDSIMKLANRIKERELNQSKLTVKTAHIGVNIETVLTDGEQQVRAFTIIASGPIQKPHYRYLVK